jgi:endonuclease/exonuclease/phosphatase family metal-dependent hydrolase
LKIKYIEFHLMNSILKIEKIWPIIKWVLLLPIMFLFYVVVSLFHATLTDFEPPEKTVLNIQSKNENNLITSPILSFLNWNIGFAGLGAKSNFFYDSNQSFFFSDGKMVRSPEAFVDENLKGIIDFIQSNPTDFVLLQEVDRSSKRSYYRNQHDLISAKLNGYSQHFAFNYQVARVIIPLFNPWNVLGKVASGLSSFSTYNPISSDRYQYPGKYNWPDYLFHLDRCMSVQRYPTSLVSDKELVVVNTHNSAYDGGYLKPLEMTYLKGFLLAEYEKGNYVVVGGDWNQNPPGVSNDEVSIAAGVLPSTSYQPSQIDEKFMPGNWQWVFDPTVPTSRSLVDVLDYGRTSVALIDYYLISPNIEAIEVKGFNLKFQYSDHNPVMMNIRLKDL